MPPSMGATPCHPNSLMSDPLLIGATGLVGTLVLDRAHGRPLTALVRRPITPPAPTITVDVGDSSTWPNRIAAIRPDTLLCCLGTTRRQAGSEAAFRAVDQHLVLNCAQAAADAGARQMIIITSVGANPKSGNLYLNAKGLVEQGISAMAFDRVDFLHPGLLIGDRAERRVAERMAQIAAPLMDALMQGSLRRYRSIRADTVANAIWTLVGKREAGRFTHEHDAILRLATE